MHAPGACDRRSGGEADDRTCHRADRAKHDRARHRTESRIARALLRSRFERGEQRARDQCSDQKHPHGKSPANHAPRDCENAAAERTTKRWNITKKPASSVGCRRFGFFDGTKVAVICPTCQLARPASRYLRYFSNRNLAPDLDHLIVGKAEEVADMGGIALHDCEESLLPGRQGGGLLAGGTPLLFPQTKRLRLW